MNELETSVALSPGQLLTLPKCPEARADGPEKLIDSERLAEVMKEREFHASRTFRAFVIEMTLDEKNTKVIEERRFDYGGRSHEIHSWNPASTVKIFPVIAALQRARMHDFSTRARVAFMNERYDLETTLHDLVVNTLVDSNNMSYNRLVQLAGYDFLNGHFLPNNGLHHSAVRKAYDYPQWIERGESRSLRYSPPIQLEEGGRSATLSALNGRAQTPCRGSACTSLQDLGETMRRLMMQEYLPENETFALHPEDLSLVRRAMSHERRRGNQVATIFRALIKGDRVKIYNKPGYSQRWFSDNVFVFDPDNHRAWVVVMTAKRGRRGRSHAARILGRVLRDDDLKAAP